MRLIGAGTRDDVDYTLRRTWWTAPNAITVCRFLLIPVFAWFVWQGGYLTAFWVLALLGSTDWVDGYVARRFNQLSRVGQWLDPLADRLSMVIVTAVLVVFGVVPVWVIFAILIPDLVLFINTAVLFGRPPDLKVSIWGKCRTAMLLVALPLSLLGHQPFAAERGLDVVICVALVTGCALHVVAALDYFVKAHREHRRIRYRGGDTCGTLGTRSAS